MKRVAIYGLVIFALGGCEDHSRVPAAAYRHWKDRLIVAAGLTNWGVSPCDWTQPDAAEQCLRFDAPRHWRGRWLTRFEDSQFCPDGAKSCGFASRPHYRLVWTKSTLPIIRQLIPTTFKSFADMERTYELDFIGRRTSHEGPYALRDHLILVDRMNSVKQLSKAGMHAVESKS